MEFVSSSVVRWRAVGRS